MFKILLCLGGGGGKWRCRYGGYVPTCHVVITFSPSRGLVSRGQVTHHAIASAGRSREGSIGGLFPDYPPLILPSFFLSFPPSYPIFYLCSMPPTPTSTFTRFPTPLEALAHSLARSLAHELTLSLSRSNAADNWVVHVCIRE